MIILCVLLLIAYIFDISSKYTRIPSVILLLFLGWLVQQLTKLFKLNIPDLNELLPALGSIGLILIVLEGSLELEINHTKKRMIKNSLFMALAPMILLTGLISLLFFSIGKYEFKDCILNAIPLAVISSAIAIPSVRNLSTENKEFIIYESSFSDVFGVLFFNFIFANEVIDLMAFGNFGLQLLIMLVFTIIATVILSFLLNKIKHHIKFIPIILLVILIYEISKVYNLPGLIFILIFGMFIGNLNELKRFHWMQRLRPGQLNREVHKFKELIIEGAFLVRASFFILFGFLISSKEILNPDTIVLSLIIFFSTLFFRFLFLVIFRLPIMPLLFIAPRGLITILLFLSIPASRYIPFINNSVVLQVIILTTIFMMVGLMVNKKDSNKTPFLPIQ
jgi:cell volume regulation protein A